MRLWQTGIENTGVGIVRRLRKAAIESAPNVAAAWIGLDKNDTNTLNPFSRCNRDSLRWYYDNGRVRVHVHTADTAEVSIDMEKDKIDNQAFGVNGSIERETSKENGMVATCLYDTSNPEAWIEIEFQHNDAEMRHFRY